jgi:hypothetical protein
VAEADSIAAGTSDNSASQTVSGFFPGPFSRMTAASRCAGAARARLGGQVRCPATSAVQLTARATARMGAHVTAHVTVGARLRERQLHP